jgi:hypothetical protein
LFVSLIIIFIYSKYPQIFHSIGAFIKTQDLSYWTSVGPISILAVNGKFCKNILFPHEKNKVLLNWDDYSELKIMACIGVVWSFIAMILFFLPFLSPFAIPAQIIGVLITCSLCIFLITTSTMWIASIQIRELLEKNT